MKKRRIALMTLLALCMALMLSVMPMSVFSAESAGSALVGTQLTTSHAGKTLSGDYYVEPGTTLTLRGGTGVSGIKVDAGKTLTIHIPADSILKVYGGAASGTAGAGAGIEVNSGSTLKIIGEGKLYAYGGNAANGTSGANGEKADWVDDGKSYIPDGGYGGNGGGGAGAGIGTKGGAGGSGAGWTRGFYGGLRQETNKFMDQNYNGNQGGTGGSGSSASACGAIYISATVTCTADGGNQGTSGGSGGSKGATDYESDDGDIRGIAGGAGGGGGGSGKAGANIGTGGGGGGGGGAGGGVGYAWSCYFVGGGGGGGGAGAVGGAGGAWAADGEIPDQDCDKYTNGKTQSSLSGGAGGTTSGGSGGRGTQIKIRSSKSTSASWSYPTAGNGGSGGSAGSACSEVTPQKLYEVTVSVEDAIVGTYHASADKFLPTSMEVPAKTGYTFKGFFADDVAYYDKDGNRTSAAITKDTTITAQYEVNSYTYGIESVEDAGETTGELNYGDSITLMTPTRDGYLFRGWEISAKNGVVNPDAYYTYAAVTPMTRAARSGEQVTASLVHSGGVAMTAGFEQIGESITLYNLSADDNAELTIKEVWVRDSFTATFKDFDGVALGTVTGKYGTDLTAPALPDNQNEYYNYTFKYWKCNIDGEYYTSDQLPFLGYYLSLEGELGDKVYDDVTFTAVYTITEYKKELHLVGSLGNDNLLDGKLILNSGSTNIPVITNFALTRNNGVADLLLIPQYDTSAFTIQAISINGESVYSKNGQVANSTTLLDGFVVSVTGDYSTSEPLKILLDNITPDSSTSEDDIFVQIVYVMKTAIGGEYDFGFVTKTPEDTDHITHGDRSEAYGTYDPDAGSETDAWRFNELKITVDSTAIQVVIQATGEITIDQNQSFVYNGQQMTAADVSEMIANALQYTYNGYAQRNEDTLKITWYDANGNQLDKAPTNVGTYQIRISADATTYYTAAPEVRATFTITPYEIFVTAGNQSYIYNGSNIVIDSAASNGAIYAKDAEGNRIPVDAFVNSQITLTGVQLLNSYANVGVYDQVIRGVLNGVTDNYKVTYENGTLTITKAENNWGDLPNDKTVEYSGNGVAIDTPTADFGDVKIEYLVGYEKDANGDYVLDSNGERIPIWSETPPTDAGTYPVRVTVSGNENYSDLSYEVTLVITKKVISADGFTFDAIDKYYNGNSQYWSLNPDDDVTTDDAEVKILASDANASLLQYIALAGMSHPNGGYTDAGVYVIHAILQISNPNYTFKNDLGEEVDSWIYENVEVQILKRKIEITVEDQIAEYDGTEPTVSQGKGSVTITLEDGSKPTFITLDFFGGIVYVPASDNFASNVTYYVKNENGTYEMVTGISEDTFDANKSTIQYYVRNTVDPTEILTLSKVLGVNAGDYALTLDQDSFKNYEIIAVNNGTFTITKRVIQIPSFDSVVYNGQTQIPTVSDEFQTIYAIISAGYRNAGDHDVVLQLMDPANNCWDNGTDAETTVVWTILKKEVTVTLPDASQSYTYGDLYWVNGSLNQDIAWNGSYVWDPEKAPVDGDDITVTFGFAVNHHFAAGEHIANQYQISGDDAANYDVTVTGGKVTVNKKTLTDELLQQYIEAVLKYYNGSAQSWSVNDFTATLKNLIDEDVIAIDSVASHSFTDANGIYNSETGAFAYYDATRYSANVTVALLDTANYQLSDDYEVAIEVKIAKAENSWTSGPSVDASGISNIDQIQHAAIPLFGNIGETKYTVGFYTDEDCQQALTNAAFDANGTYYAKFTVEDTNNYYGLSTVIVFSGSYTTVIKPVVRLDNETGEIFVAGQSITIIYDGQEHTFFVPAGDGYVVSANPTGTNVGTYTVTVTLKEKHTWADGSTGALTYTLVINKATLTITATDKTIAYKDAAPEYSYVASGLVNGETLAGLLGENNLPTVGGTYAAGENVGTYEITVTLSTDLINANLSNYDVQINHGTLTVTPCLAGLQGQVPAPSFHDVSLVYNGQNRQYAIDPVTNNIYEIFNWTVTYSLNGQELGAGELPKNAGTYTVKIELSVKDDIDLNNYVEPGQTITIPVIQPVTLMVTKAEITITVGDQVFSYDGDDYANRISQDASQYVITFTDDVILPTEDFTFVALSVVNGSAIHAGRYDITAGYTNSANCVVTVENGALVINKVDNNWVGQPSGDLTFVYDTNKVEPGTDFTFDPKFGDGDITYTYYEKVGEEWQQLSGAPTQAGEYAVLATVPGTGNYNVLNSNRVEFTIGKATITIGGISFEDATYIYNGSKHSIYVTDNASSAIFTVTYTGNEQINAGEYTVTATFVLADDRNYTFNGADTMTATLTIQKAQVVITAIDQSSAYEEALKTLTYRIEFIGADGYGDFYEANFGAVTLATAATAWSNVGAYDITIDYVSSGNYDVTTKKGVYTITKFEGNAITLNAEDVRYLMDLIYSASADRGEDEIVFTFATSEDGEYTSVLPKNVGKYYVKATIVGTDNYDGAVATQTFDITKAILSAITDVTYNADTATWTAVVTTTDGKSIDCNVTYLVDNNNLTTPSFTATKTGSFTVVAVPSDTHNYENSAAVTLNTVYSVSFADKAENHPKQDSLADLTDAAFAIQYRFAGQSVTRPGSIPAIVGYTFRAWQLNGSDYGFADGVQANITLYADWTIQSFTLYFYNEKVTGSTVTNGIFVEGSVSAEEFYRYTVEYGNTFNLADVTNPTKEADAAYTYAFAYWADAFRQGNKVEGTVTVYGDMSFYAVYTPTAKQFTITYMVSIDGSAYKQHNVVTMPYGSALESLDAVVWFIGDTWYIDAARQTSAPKIVPAGDMTLYGAYVFDIGAGDVNADGTVDTDDIVNYRRWVVGGYNIVTVEAGDEWDLVTSTAYDPNTVYYLVRVSDANQDSSGDIRDITTIRMALTGGYGYGCLSGRDTVAGVTGEGVVIVDGSISKVTTAEELKAALAEGGFILLNADLAFSETVTISKDTVFYLNGYDLDLSANAARPFVMASNATLVIYGEGATVKTGNYGLVSIPATADNATVEIYGGTYTANTDNGSFIRLADNSSMDASVVLQGIKLTDSSANGKLLCGDCVGGNVSVEIIDCDIEVAKGVIIDSPTSDIYVSNSTFRCTYQGISAGGFADEDPTKYAHITVENCEITVTRPSNAGNVSGEEACLVVGYGGKISVSNSTLSSDTSYIAGICSYADYSEITITNCTINHNSDVNSLPMFYEIAGSRVVVN